MSPSIRLSTAIGALAILLWSSLAILTTGARAVPPFQLTAMTFALAFLLVLAKWLVRGEPVYRYFRQRASVWLVGIGGLFGYHFFYFVALRSAPPVEANLINYLWPLLIVVFSALLPGERLRWFHMAGVLMGLAGTALLITGGKLDLKAEYLPGYLSALACAVTWAAYSVTSRRFGSVPTDAVGGFCGATAILATICHLAFEATVWPEGSGWLVILAMGIGPMGAAFFLWDHGVKRGDIKALGAAAYATPLLSTLLLIAFGQAEASLALALSLALVVGGAVLGAGGLYRRRA